MKRRFLLLFFLISVTKCSQPLALVPGYPQSTRWVSRYALLLPKNNLGFLHRSLPLWGPRYRWGPQSLSFAEAQSPGILDGSSERSKWSAALFSAPHLAVFWSQPGPAGLKTPCCRPSFSHPWHLPGPLWHNLSFLLFSEALMLPGSPGSALPVS